MATHRALAGKPGQAGTRPARALHAGSPELHHHPQPLRDQNPAAVPKQSLWEWSLVGGGRVRQRRGDSVSDPQVMDFKRQLRSSVNCPCEMEGEEIRKGGREGGVRSESRMATGSQTRW